MILIQNWCKMIFWLPCLFLWWFLIQFLFKIDAKCSPGCHASPCGGFLFRSYSELMQNDLLAALPPPVVASYSILVQNWCKMLSGLTCLLLWWFLIQFSFKIDAKCSSGCRLLLWWFLIQFSFKINVKCSLDCLGSSCGGFLRNREELVTDGES